MARWFHLSFLTFKYAGLFLLRLFGLVTTPSPRLVRQYLEEAGGAFVKIGQLLALRYEVLPPQYCWELSELFDNVLPMPFQTIETIVQQELGGPIHQHFTIFEEQPIASASFAQVHKAILPSGQTVAVKVQRPGLKPMVESDFRFLKVIAWLATPYFQLKALPISEVVAELEESTMRELDYRLEKDNAELIRAKLPAQSRFVVPQAYPELTTGKLLVQEFIDGIKLNDVLRAKNGNIQLTQLDVAHLELDQIALDLLAEISRQYFIEGIYHADPHPGNIIITREGKIAFVDFGIVGHIKPFNRGIFWDFVKHVTVNVDYDQATQAFLRLGLRPLEDRIRFLANDSDEPLEPFFEIINNLANSYEKSFRQIVNRWSQASGNPAESIYDRSTAVAFLKSVRLAEQYNVHFPKDIILFIRTLVIADMMATQLSPTFRMDAALRRFVHNCGEDIKALEGLVDKTAQIDLDERFVDPWNQEARDKTREYIYEWFSSLIDDRPELYQKIKEPAQRLRKSIEPRYTF